MKKFKENFKRFWSLQKHSNGGFTLVELIVVIAILAILAGIAVPAYSGYVEKANKAADEQLLANLNTAFASACAVNGEAHQNQNASSTKIILTDADGDGDRETIVLENDNVAIVESFGTFFEGGEFKVFTKLKYVQATGMFVDNSEGGAYSELFHTLKEKYGDEIDDVLATSLGQIGTENLFTQMNNAMDMAGELNLHTLSGEPFAEAYFSYLDFDPSAYDDDEAAQAAFEAKLAELGVDDATASTHAIALYAAQNSEALTTDRLNQWLGGEKSTDDLQNNASANTLAEAAAIYGMYLSYQKETNGTVPTGSTLDVMADALTSADFATWVNSSPNAQNELDAYKTYMNILNDAAKDKSARNEILANGFKNPEFENLMKELMGN